MRIKWLPALYCITQICLLLGFSVSAQNQENIWVFGHHAGLDFSSGAPVPVVTAIEGLGEANASVCDANGQLLFYTNGTTVWDRNHNTMPDGAALIALFQPNNVAPTSSTCQGAVIVPVPYNSNRYYIFSLTSIETTGGYLYYSLVDMSLNNGLGDIVPGQKGVQVDSNLSERMTTITGEACNVWLLVRAKMTNHFKSYRIDAGGIEPTPQLSPVGSIFGGLFTGEISVAPNRRKIALANGGFPTGLAGGLELFDFDPATGILSNAVVLDGTTGFYGAEFSADNSKLYASSPATLKQFDLSAAGATQTVIGSSALSHLKRAANGKIYCKGSSASGHLSVINAPEQAALGCDYEINAIALPQGSRINAGLPNVVSVVPIDTVYGYTDIPAACFASEVQLEVANGDEGWNFEWDNGMNTAQIMVSAPGKYAVRYYLPPCSYHIDTFEVRFPWGVLPNIQIDTACAGANNGGARASTYQGDTVTYTYFWIKNNDTLSGTAHLTNATSGYYNLSIHTATCDTVISLHIPEVNYKVGFTMPDSIICQQTSVQYNNTSDGHFTDFNWDFGNGNTSNSTQPGSVLYQYAGSYEVRLIGKGAFCTDTASVLLKVDSLWPVHFSVSSDAICMGEQVSVRTDIPAEYIQGITWNWGDETRAYTSYEEEIKHSYDRSGAMSLQFTVDFRACPDEVVQDTVVVHELPKVDLGSDTSMCLHAPALILKNLADNPAVAYNYQWSTGDTGAALQAVHYGVYQLRVTDRITGCANTEEITISKDCYLDIPNAFTPNGDGVNDYFFPRPVSGRSIQSFHMRIIDRWGLIVFETQNPAGRGWDGRLNGKEQVQGAYVYTIEVQFTNGQQEQYTGNVTLIR
jgi:gliding motility-associated-like protein